MASAYLHRHTTGPIAHRVERRARKRRIQARALAAGRLVVWTIGFFVIGWLVAAGFYGLLVNA